MAKMKVGVVGTGVMGTGTVVLLIGNRYPAVMLGRTPESCARGTAVVHETLDDLIGAGLLTPAQKEEALTYFTATCSYEDLADCGVVFESAIETIETKREVMGKLEAVCSKDTIIGSTTSAISANSIAECLEHKDRFMVAHSWNPPHLVPLVEIVKSDSTSEQAVADMNALLEELGRVPVVLKKDAPGFIGNRLHNALFREALYMIDEGIATAEDIDKTILNSIGQRYSSIGLMEYWDKAPIDLQYNVQSYLFPHLCNADKPSDTLMSKRVTGDTLYNWTEEHSTDYEMRKKKPFYAYATLSIADEK